MCETRVLLSSNIAQLVFWGSAPTAKVLSGLEGSTPRFPAETGLLPRTKEHPSPQPREWLNLPGVIIAVIISLHGILNFVFLSPERHKFKTRRGGACPKLAWPQGQMQGGAVVPVAAHGGLSHLSHLYSWETPGFLLLLQLPVLKSQSIALVGQIKKLSVVFFQTGNKDLDSCLNNKQANLLLSAQQCLKIHFLINRNVIGVQLLVSATAGVFALKSLG